MFSRPSLTNTLLLRLLFGLCLLLIALPSQPQGRNLSRVDSSGQKRVALVIGNSAYPGGDLPKLTNPVHDADDIAAALRGFGFQVIERKDVGLREMNDAVAEFGRQAANADAALFYFAGHGIQIKSQNYLVPVDARAQSEAAMAYEAVNVNYLLEELDNAKSRVNIVMLDACRDNPLSGRFRSGGSRGLAAPASAPKGTVIVYATDPGNVAADGKGRNGLFTAGILTGLQGQDLSLDGVLTVASAEVDRQSQGKQTPYVNGPQLVKKNFYFKFQGPTTVVIQPPVNAADPEAEAWQAAQSVGSAAAYQAYLDAYPKGRYAAAARIKLAGPRPASPSDKPAKLPPVAGDDAETAFWSEVKASGAREYFEAYLKQYPKGKYLALARLELKKFDDAERARKAQEDANRAALAAQQRQDQEQQEQQAWNSAKSGNSVAAYAGYLAQYPKGRFAALAEAAQQKLQRESAEQARLAAEKQRAEAERQRLAAEKAANERRSVKVFKDCADCPEMVVIPAGSFNMGSPEWEEGRDDNEGPQHRVSVRSFALAKTEVTQGQWQAVMGSYPSDFKYCGDDCPVIKVSWKDAQEYVIKLSAKTGKTYRLPSEAEWEYACRGGSSQRYCGSDDLNAVAWWGGGYVNSGGNSGKTTNPVARKLANGFGLYDMSGNVQEWVEDCYHDSYSGAPVDGSAWVSGNCSYGRVVRGGSWANRPQDARSAKRGRGLTAYRLNDLGFRPARMLP